MAINKIEIQDSDGNIYYPHTDASVVKIGDSTVEDMLEQINIIQTAGGSATAITLTNVNLVNGFTISFLVASNNNGVATTINGKNLYKFGGTAAPTLTAGKVVTVWYNGTSFFIKASAEGDAVAANVLAGKKFSNDSDTGITGTMVNNGPSAAETINITSEGGEYTIPTGYHSGLRKIKAVITNIAAAVIKAGVTVGGIAGTFTADATATAAQILSGVTAYVNGNKITGSMSKQVFAVRGNTGYVTGTPKADGTGVLCLAPTERGYYDIEVNSYGFGMILAYDANFVAANILSGKSFFGLAGNAVAGKKFASGTFTSSSPFVNFRQYNIGQPSTVGSIAYKNISDLGLGFIPRIIFYYPTTMYGNGFSIYLADGILMPDGTYYYIFQSDVARRYENGATVILLTPQANTSYNFLAWE